MSGQRVRWWTVYGDVPRRGHYADLEVAAAILRSDPRERASGYDTSPRSMASAVENILVEFGPAHNDLIEVVSVADVRTEVERLERYDCETVRVGSDYLARDEAEMTGPWSWGEWVRFSDVLELLGGGGPNG